MTVVLPNIRKLFVPDPGYILIDCDLAGAEAQVVAAEANDLPLLKKFQTKVDIHKENATWKWGSAFTSLSKDSNEYYIKRQACKHSVHAIHNGGHPKAMSAHSGIKWPVSECEAFRNHWLGEHPGILTYHKRTESNLFRSRMAINRFGYRIIYFDRIDQLLQEALAWVPQSTIAEVTFRGALQLEERCPYVEMLLQVHDSLVFQIPKDYFHTARLLEIQEALKVPVPYDPPLVIPWKLSASDKSWGDCREIDLNMKAA
jgi:DNA polymerase I